MQTYNESHNKVKVLELYAHVLSVQKLAWVIMVTNWRLAPQKASFCSATIPVLRAHDMD